MDLPFWPESGSVSAHSRAPAVIIGPARPLGSLTWWHWEARAEVALEETGQGGGFVSSSQSFGDHRHTSGLPGEGDITARGWI